jgi:asparagine synthase (glutamine-hydrolysing)
MCGIFGAVRFDGLFDNAEVQQFVTLTDLVRYRGPDDSGYVTLNVGTPVCESKGCHIFLGNRRLAIIDLSSAGHQPMQDQQGHWITFNGEIFNYIELRRELQAHGHLFSTLTDTEVILHVYDEYGEDGFDRLNGMWAFALLDVPRRRLVLSRDRFSINPLYTLQLPNRLYFASEIKQLYPLLPQRTLNPTVVSQFLAQGLLDHSRDTFFAGIQRVPAKTNIVIELDGGKVSEKKYWSFSTPSANGHRDECEIAAEFHQLLRDSIRIRLRSDVKIGVLLSGGLDSSAIAVICKDLGQADLHTYSVVADDKRFSEELFVDAVAATGIANEKIGFRPEHVLDDLNEAVYHNDEPFGGLSIVAHYRLLRTVKQATDTTVLLSGQGGDEVLLGYLKFFFFHLRTLLRQGQYLRALSEAAASLAQGTMMRQFTLGEARRYMSIAADRGVGLLRQAPQPVPIWNCEDVRERQMADIETYSVPALTHYEDRNSTAHSLELRHPFLDHRLVEFLVALPMEYKIRNGWTKYLLRQSLPELPPAIRWRKDKQGFLTPEARWLKQELKTLIQSMFRESKLEELGILNANEFLRRYEHFLRGRPISPLDISRVLIAEVWVRQFIN